MSTERPILFSGPMVRAILEGRKTQTRRVVKPQPDANVEFAVFREGRAEFGDRGAPMPHTIANCPYGHPGDLLWVRETWAENLGAGGGILYRADHSEGVSTVHEANLGTGKWTVHMDRWRPSIHMPKWACRLWLRVEDVRVERLQEITEEDALAEGVPANPYYMGDGSLDECMSIPARANFAHLWDEINGDRFPWDSNPWVWVVEFSRTEAPS